MSHNPTLNILECGCDKRFISISVDNNKTKKKAFTEWVYIPFSTYKLSKETFVVQGLELEIRRREKSLYTRRRSQVRESAPSLRSPESGVSLQRLIFLGIFSIRWPIPTISLICVMLSTSVCILYTFTLIHFFFLFSTMKVCLFIISLTLITRFLFQLLVLHWTICVPLTVTFYPLWILFAFILPFTRVYYSLWASALHLSFIFILHLLFLFPLFICSTRCLV